METLDRIIKETKDWLDNNGYNPMVASIHLEALDLKNKQLSIKVLKEALPILFPS